MKQSHNPIIDHEWSQIWKLKALKKIRILILSECHGSTPTLLVLHQKGMSVSSNCQHCGNSSKDFLHFIHDCPRSEQIWKRMRFTDSGLFSTENPKTWLRMGSTGPHQFLTTLWSTWTMQNAKSINKDVVENFKVYCDTCQMAEQLFKEAYLSWSICRLPRWVTWHPSVDDVVVLNIDNSNIQNLGISGFGGVLLNGQGEWIHYAQKAFHQRLSLLSTVHKSIVDRLIVVQTRSYHNACEVLLLCHINPTRVSSQTTLRQKALCVSVHHNNDC